MPRRGTLATLALSTRTFLRLHNSYAYMNTCMYIYAHAYFWRYALYMHVYLCIIYACIPIHIYMYMCPLHLHILPSAQFFEPLYPLYAFTTQAQAQAQAQAEAEATCQASSQRMWPFPRVYYHVCMSHVTDA